MIIIMIIIIIIIVILVVLNESQGPQRYHLVWSIHLVIKVCQLVQFGFKLNSRVVLLDPQQRQLFTKIICLAFDVQTFLPYYDKSLYYILTRRAKWRMHRWLGRVVLLC